MSDRSRPARLRSPRDEPGYAVQLVLPITRVLLAAGTARAVEAPARGELFPWEQVRCKLGGTLMVQACLTRRAKVYPSGGQTGKGGGPKGQPVVLECRGCALGEAYAARAPWFVPPPPSRPAEVLSPAQRAAKARYRAEHELDDQGWLDPLAEVALMSPDDHGL